LYGATAYENLRTVLYNPSKTGNKCVLERVLKFFMVSGGARYPIKNENNCIIEGFLQFLTVLITPQK
jgi:hypothetical protein